MLNKTLEYFLQTLFQSPLYFFFISFFFLLPFVSSITPSLFLSSSLHLSFPFLLLLSACLFSSSSHLLLIFFSPICLQIKCMYLFGKKKKSIRTKNSEND
ncbi:unnamed protein product [Prunus armeniaca]